MTKVAASILALTLIACTSAAEEDVAIDAETTAEPTSETSWSSSTCHSIGTCKQVCSCWTGSSWGRTTVGACTYNRGVIYSPCY